MRLSAVTSYAMTTPRFGEIRVSPPRYDIDPGATEPYYARLPITLTAGDTKLVSFKLEQPDFTIVHSAENGLRVAFEAPGKPKKEVPILPQQIASLIRVMTNERQSLWRRMREGSVLAKMKQFEDSMPPDARGWDERSLKPLMQPYPNITFEPKVHPAMYNPLKETLTFFQSLVFPPKARRKAS